MFIYPNRTGYNGLFGSMPTASSTCRPGGTEPANLRRAEPSQVAAALAGRASPSRLRGSTACSRAPNPATFYVDPPYAPSAGPRGLRAIRPKVRPPGSETTTRRDREARRSRMSRRDEQLDRIGNRRPLRGQPGRDRSRAAVSPRCCAPRNQLECDPTRNRRGIRSLQRHADSFRFAHCAWDDDRIAGRML
jgi:hypothetical protein